MNDLQLYMTLTVVLSIALLVFFALWGHERDQRIKLQRKLRDDGPSAYYEMREQYTRRIDKMQEVTNQYFTSTFDQGRQILVLQREVTRLNRALQRRCAAIKNLRHKTKGRFDYQSAANKIYSEARHAGNALAGTIFDEKAMSEYMDGVKEPGQATFENAFAKATPATVKLLRDWDSLHPTTKQEWAALEAKNGPLRD